MVKNVGKGKGKAWDDDAEEEGKGAGKKSKKEVKQRFILFIGGLYLCRIDRKRFELRG